MWNRKSWQHSAVLVAGIAHEVNTPVGVALTAATALRAEADTLGGKATEGQIRKSEVVAFINMATESTRLMERNCERAANLIQSFKQVSVDQISDQRRRFLLMTYLRDVLESLGPALKKGTDRLRH